MWAPDIQYEVISFLLLTTQSAGRVKCQRSVILISEHINYCGLINHSSCKSKYISIISPCKYIYVLMLIDKATWNIGVIIMWRMYCWFEAGRLNHLQKLSNWLTGNRATRLHVANITVHQRAKSSTFHSHDRFLSKSSHPPISLLVFQVATFQEVYSL